MATEVDKVNNGALATLIAVVALGVIGVALAVTALTRQQVSAHHEEKEGMGQAEKLALVKAQKAALEQGVPIQTAMQTLVRELAKNPQSASPPPTAQAAAPAAAGAGGAAGASSLGAAGGGTGGAASGGAGPAAAAGASPKTPPPATPKPPPSGTPSAPHHGP